PPKRIVAIRRCGFYDREATFLSAAVSALGAGAYAAEASRMVESAFIVRMRLKEGPELFGGGGQDELVADLPGGQRELLIPNALLEPLLADHGGAQAGRLEPDAVDAVGGDEMVHEVVPFRGQRLKIEDQGLAEPREPARELPQGLAVLDA